MALKAKTVRDSEVIVDDGALHAETVARKDRMPLFDKNGLEACKDVKFSMGHKNRAWSLIRP